VIVSTSGLWGLLRDRSGWLLATALLLGCAGGCEFSGQRGAAERSEAGAGARSFDVLYRQNCAGCHGASGKLGPAPPLADKLFLALISEQELRSVISAGRPGTLMPAFASDQGGRLSADEVAILVQGIKSRWGGPSEPVARGAPPYRLEGAAASKESGLKVFARACASCHGESGQGGTYAGESGGNPVGAVNVPEFLALLSDQALRRLIITGRADLGMPGWSDGQGRPAGYKPLSSHEVTELVALLASWRKGAESAGKGN
jgi:cytochrome c oxidase cbb3-type subunit III